MLLENDNSFSGSGLPEGPTIPSEKFETSSAADRFSDPVGSSGMKSPAGPWVRPGVQQTDVRDPQHRQTGASLRMETISDVKGRRRLPTVLSSHIPRL